VREKASTRTSIAAFLVGTLTASFALKVRGRRVSSSMVSKQRACASGGWRAGAWLACATVALACSPAEPLHGAAHDDGAALGRGDATAADAGAADATGGNDGATASPDADDDVGPGVDGGANAADAPGDATTERATPPGELDAGGADAPALTSYEAESGALFGQAAKVPCATCSNGQRVAIAPDSGFTLSGVVAPDAGTNMLVIYYTNGDSKGRSIYIGVNGGDSQLLLAVFPPTGNWTSVSSITVPLSGFKAGSNNTIMFFIDTELGPPDLDRVALAATSVVGNATNACDHTSWKATASVTGGDGGGPAAAIDGDLKTRWASNRPQMGVDWFQVDFGAFVKLNRITLDNTQSYPNDFAGSYAVYGSLDGVTFDAAPFVTGNGAANATVINFSQRTVRAVKITQVGAARSPSWWQIGELEVVCYQ
jgi:F5/8 type C domain